MKSKILNKIKQIKYLDYLLITVVTIIICIPLFNKNLNIYRDDGIQHICRLIGTEQTIKEKQFLPMIMSNFCNNFGYSWNIFYSPLTAYAPLIFRIFSFSYTNCLKIFIFIVNLLSGFAMYKFMFKVTKNKNISTFAAILYVIAPYRLTDIYLRTAIAELTSFVFVPIIFNGLYTIINKEEKSYLLSWGILGLILTHTIITLYTAILCLIYLLIFIKKLKNKKVIINLLINLLFGLITSSFYWVGLLQHYFATSYEVFVPGRMEREEALKYYKIDFYQLFFTRKEQIMIYAIGLVSVIGLVLTPVAYKKISKDYKKLYTTFLIFGLILTFMTLTIFPFEKLPKILTMIQFTFRLFEFTSFFFAFVVAINYETIIKDFKLKDILILSAIAMLLLIPYLNKLDYDLRYSEDKLINGVRVTKNTGRVHAGMASMEYLPSKAFNNLDYLINRENSIIVLDNENVKINEYTKNKTNIECTVSNIDKKTSIELPYIYYLGYRIYVNGKEISYTESEKGFIQVSIETSMCENKTAKIKVRYLGTNEMIIALMFSIIAIIILIIIQNQTL
mgnify:CR=1 FL=1